MSEKAVILNLPAYNEVEIISMVFRSFDEGVAYVKSVLGRDPDKLEEGVKAVWDAYNFFNGTPSVLKEGETIPKEILKNWKEEREWIKNNPDKFTEEVKPDYDKIKKLVKGYYGGCGEAGNVEVKVVDYSTPLCEFDFD